MIKSLVFSIVIITKQKKQLGVYMSSPVNNSLFSFGNFDPFEVQNTTEENNKTQKLVESIFTGDGTGFKVDETGWVTTTGEESLERRSEEEEPVSKRPRLPVLSEEPQNMSDDLLNQTLMVARAKIGLSNQPGSLTSLTSSKTIAATSFQRAAHETNETFPEDVIAAMIGSLSTNSTFYDEINSTFYNKTYTFYDKIKAIIFLLREKNFTLTEINGIFHLARCPTIDTSKIFRFRQAINSGGDETMLDRINKYPILEEKTDKNNTLINTIAETLQKIFPTNISKTNLIDALEKDLKEAAEKIRIEEESTGANPILQQNGPTVKIKPNVKQFSILDNERTDLLNVIIKIDQFYSINPTIISQLNKENFILQTHLQSANKQISKIEDNILLIKSLAIIKSADNESPFTVVQRLNNTLYPVTDGSIYVLRDNFTKLKNLALTKKTSYYESNNRKVCNYSQLVKRLAELTSYVPAPQQNTTVSQPEQNTQPVINLSDDDEKLWDALAKDFPPPQ